MEFYSNKVCAVRGATTVEQDTPEAIQEALGELLSVLIETNRITEARVITLFISVTNDIHSASPARITRNILNWQSTAMMSSQEPDITGYPPRCIRILIQYYGEQPASLPRPAYLRGAAQLRPDWVS